MNRLREAEHTSDDVDMLKRRLIDQADKIPKDAICLFTTNKKVDDHNDMAYNASPTQKCIILSFDIVIGDVCQAVKWSTVIIFLPLDGADRIAVLPVPSAKRKCYCVRSFFYRSLQAQRKKTHYICETNHEQCPPNAVCLGA